MKGSAGNAVKFQGQKVIIFMCTHNGQQFLAEQIESIINQTHKNWELWISDDGSKDNTHAILASYQNKLGVDQFRIKKCPYQGFAQNFLSLILECETNGDFFAYSDQDDIWIPDKLQKGIEWLNTLDQEISALYCSRTELIDKNGTPIGFSKLFTRPPSFLNALVQNIAGGNTMIFNKPTLNLLRKSRSNVKVVAHDWWTYLLVSGTGGMIHYDPYPSILYRQHDTNLIGSNTGWKARITRLNMLFNNRFRKWHDSNLRALLCCEHLLNAENKRILHQIINARKKWLIPRILTIKQIGIYRQTFIGNIGLFIGIFFKKI